MKSSIVAALLLVFTICICAHGQTYQGAFEKSRALLKEKRYSEALQEAQRAIALDGAQWGAYYVAGTALVGLGRQGEAISLFQSALAHAPDKAKPTINTAIEACHQALANKSQAPAPVPAYSPQPSKSAGTWTDPATGLMWTGTDNGSDVNWQQATDYCRNLQLAAHRDWRLPKIEELQGIYDPNANVGRWHVRGNLQLSGWQWSGSQENGPRAAWFFAFNSGVHDSVLIGGSNGGRAVCVRP